MTKKLGAAFAFLTGFLAVALPIIVALYIARQDSITNQMATAGALAGDVLRRADEAGYQSARVISTLKATHTAAPCADPQVRLMSSLAVESDVLQGVGYVANDHLVCSSLGSYGTQLPIGPADYVSATKTYVRTTVSLPNTSDKKFAVMASGNPGYATILDPDLVRDVAVPGPDVSLGVFSYSTRRLMSGHGFSDRSWLEMLGKAHQMDFTDGLRLISLRRSARFDTVAFAAVPVAISNEAVRRQADVLVPVGLIAGICLAAALVYITRQQSALPSVLKSALRRKEFYCEYQPVVDLQTRQWVGAEVLVRWRRASGEIVSPDVFIPVAEESGLIRKVTEQVVEIVSREAESLFHRFPDFHLGINLAAADLATPDTIKLVVKLIEATGAKKGNLIVEATERGMIKNSIALALLRDIRLHGVDVAIDDFGTGYSSLSYLQTFKLDILKIDKSFVDTIGTDAATSQVVYHIMEMAKGLNLRMIAEGVETEAQAKVLRDHGVELAQGWLFAKSMKFTELEAQLGAAMPQA